MEDLRKTREIRILPGYEPEQDRRRAGYISAVFAAFWRLASYHKDRRVDVIQQKHGRAD